MFRVNPITNLNLINQIINICKVLCYSKFELLKIYFLKETSLLGYDL